MLKGTSFVWLRAVFDLVGHLHAVVLEEGDFSAADNGEGARAAVVLEDGFRDAKSGVLEVILAKDAAGRCYNSG